MIVVCSHGHEWNTDERDDVEVGQACGALLYFNYDKPEDTVRCTQILEPKIMTVYFPITDTTQENN